MKVKDILLLESGIRIPKGTKAAKIIFHRDLDGVFSAIITYNQLIKQGIDRKNIILHGIQYGGESTSANMKKYMIPKKGQMIALVDFARLDPDTRRPDFWTDHHHKEGEPKELAQKGSRIGKSEFKADTAHLAQSHAQGVMDSATIKAIEIVDSAGYTNLKDTFLLRKDFKEKNRMERLAILINALMSDFRIWNKDDIMEAFIKETKPSLVSAYNTLLKYIDLSKIQEEAIKEIVKPNPDWKKVEESRKLMPTMKMKKKIVKENTNLKEDALSDYKEKQELKVKGNKRTEEENKRYKELLNKDLNLIKHKREGSLKASVKKGGRFEPKEKIVIQSEPKAQRYLWTQLHKNGVKFPFVIKRYASLIQVAVNPDVSKELKDKIDLNAIVKNIFKEIREELKGQYQDWALDIIEGRSGGHKTITNIADLYLMFMAPKKIRTELKELETLKQRFLNLKTLGSGKLSDELKEKLKQARKEIKTFETKKRGLTDNEKKRLEAAKDKIKELEGKEGKSAKPLEKAKETIKSLENKYKITNIDEKQYAEALKKEKTLMPYFEKYMPDKAKRLEELLKIKEEYAEKRRKLIDEIINKFEKKINDLANKYNIKVDDKDLDPRFKMEESILKLKNEILEEEIKKPTEKDKKTWKGSGKLYYVIKSEEGKVLGYIDDEYVNKLSNKMNKNISPRAAAHIRLGQVEYFKKKANK